MKLLRQDVKSFGEKGENVLKEIGELLKSEEILSDIIHMGENMPGGFFIYCAEMPKEILYTNDVMIDIYGCDDLEDFKRLTGFTFQGLVYPEDYERVEAEIEEQIKKDDRHLDYVEYRIRKKDGEIRWVDDYGRLVQTEQYGEVYYVFIRDITESHLAKEENRRRLEVIEGLSVGFSSIFLLNLDTGGIYPYRQGDRYFYELLENDQQIKDWKKILPEYAKRYVLQEDRMLYMQETREERIRIRLAKENSYTVTYRCKEENRIRYMEMFISNIEQKNEENHVVMGYRDVTEQILKVQSELAEKLNIEMELEREKKENEIKSAFLFNISHDIRTPMNAIVGFTDLAVRHVEEPKLLEKYLGKLRESNQHMLALIDDLLEMSRIDYGKVELNPEICSISEQVRLVLEIYRAEAEKKGVFLVELLELPEEKVYMDALCFRRILGNLLSNAVKFTPKDGIVKISAKLKHVTEEGDSVFEFSVADSGIGISKKFMKRMFIAFEREESATESGYEGTGLGLAIAKHLLDAMGGEIHVESKKGEGSVFSVKIPFEMGKKAEELQQNGEKTETVRKVAKKHKILLVEDIEMNRMLAEELLSEEGFIVESVQDGSQAVEAIKKHDAWYYDLVLMDIQMPVMNGYEASRLIRSMNREDSVGLPIIALSANAHDEDKKKSMESGMNSHVAKPFDIEQLVRTINKYLK